jgi:hypothetical protein
MSTQSIAIANFKSFGDFVIAHSILHRVEKRAKERIRLISSSHVRDLNAILPADVCVTLMNSGEGRVPALYDVRKRGTWAATRSALSLRREFRSIGRAADEALAFDVIGVRERFIAADWPLLGPPKVSANIYETYVQFLGERQIATVAAPPPARGGIARSVGIFPESRHIAKRLTDQVLSVIYERVARTGMDARLFILDGDLAPGRGYPGVQNIPRDFQSLASAISSVDCVISADSLPGHLAEYLGRRVFIVSPLPNEYWLPQGCFASRHWGVFADPTGLASSLDTFLAQPRCA